MAAEALACELSLDLYQADLSTVVSKCISETEKHLSAIFQEAEDSQAILLSKGRPRRGNARNWKCSAPSS